MPTRRPLAAVLMAAAPAARAADADAADPYAYLVTYKLAAGMSRKPLTTIEAEIRTASDAGRRTIEGKLLAAMADPRATYGCKQFVCRMLRRIGTERSVPALAALLTDSKLSHMARFALQHLPAEEAGEALRTALGRTRGNLRIGVIASVGFRRDEQAVPALAKLAANPDEPTADAAITALGQVGSAEAAAALQKVSAPPALAGRRADALLACADAMAEAGNMRAAGDIYRALAAEGSPTFVRVAAFRGLVMVEGEKAIPTILPLVKSNVPALRQAVGAFLAKMPGEGVGLTLAKQLPDLPAGAKLIVLGALEARKATAAAPAAAQALEAEDADVRVAAARALAVIGGPDQVRPLMRTAVGEGDAAQAASDALTRLSGPGVAEAVIGLLDAPEPAVRAKALEVATARGETKALPAALQAARDTEKKVRLAAYKALAAMAGAGELPALLDLLTAAEADDERQALARAVTQTAERAGGATGPVIGALGKASPEAAASLLAILADLGGDAALAAVKAQLASRDEAVKRAAVRALADWNDPSPLDALLEVARTDADTANQVLALRGYVRLATMPGRRPDAETVRMLAEAMQIAHRPQEKRLILGALPKVACPAALDLAESCRHDADLAAEAGKAVARIRKAFVSDKLKVTASANAGAAPNAVDGKRDTRWTTGRPMKPGDWFALDFRMTVRVKAISLDHQPSANDWPRKYEVYVSDDGKDWGRPVLKGKGDKKGPTRITFPEPVETRHVKIVQTGPTTKWHWSIHRMNVEVE